MTTRASVALGLALALGALAPAQTPGRVSEEQLRGDLSFLASDALKGRYAPSPELDIAAEFVASRFRALGLLPAAGDSYFQVAHMLDRTNPLPTSPLRWGTPEGGQSIPVDDYRILNVAAAVELSSVPVVISQDATAKSIATLDVKGKVLIVPGGGNSLLKAVQTSGAAAVILAGNSHTFRTYPLLIEAQGPATYPVPVLSVHNEWLADQLKNAPAQSGWTLSVSLPGPQDQDATLQNVAGVLPGSDPVLKKEVLLVTAHYDHIGTAETAKPFTRTPATGADRIYNGADDDGSGTVSVIAIAQALRNAHPKRTILFVAFFGEERGLIGSSFYAHHPLFPVAQTIADINLEQLGRADELEDGNVTPHPLSMTLTGYRYTTLAHTIEHAGTVSGIRVYENAQLSNKYFLASDNAALSTAGIPSTTISTAFEFREYHAPGDEWQKIDYPNMARVDDAISRAVLSIANATDRPQWNAANPKTADYREAQAALMKQP